MSKIFKHLPDDAWIRTCQECFYSRVYKNPNGKPTNTYLNAKCPKCKSAALDYGKENYSNDNWIDE